MTDEYLPSDVANHIVKDDRLFIAACHAMQGMMASPTFYLGEAKCDVARRAMGYAEALLKEMNK